MMEKREQVCVTFAIEFMELIGHPVELRFVRGQIRIDREKETIPVCERKSWETVQSANSAIRRNQVRDRLEVIREAFPALFVGEALRARDVVISWREKIWNASFSRDAIDQ